MSLSTYRLVRLIVFLGTSISVGHASGSGYYRVSVTTHTPALGGSFILKCSIQDPKRLSWIMWWQQNSIESVPEVKASATPYQCGTHDDEHYFWLSCTNGTYNIKVDDVRLSDSGIWTCHDLQDHGRRSSPIKVTITAPPRKPLISGFTNPVVIGQNRGLTCQAWQEGAENIQYWWYRDGVLVSSGNTSVLSLTPVKEEHGGVYTCRANNTAGSEDSDEKKLVVIDAVPPQWKIIAPVIVVGAVVLGIVCVVSYKKNQKFAFRLRKCYGILNREDKGGRQPGLQLS